MNEKEYFMRQAIQASLDSIRSGSGGPFGAVIVKNGEIIASGTNMVAPSNDPTAHAEITVIRNTCNILGTFNLKGCEIYASCEPCPMCLAAIYWARIDKLYYANTKQDAAAIGFDDSFIYKEITLENEKRSLPTEQILGSEAMLAFHEWQDKTDKIMY